MCKKELEMLKWKFSFSFWIGIGTHFTQGWRSTTTHAVTRKRRGETWKAYKKFDSLETGQRLQWSIYSSIKDKSTL